MTYVLLCFAFGILTWLVGPADVPDGEELVGPNTGVAQVTVVRAEVTVAFALAPLMIKLHEYNYAVAGEIVDLPYYRKMQMQICSKR